MYVGGGGRRHKKALHPPPPPIDRSECTRWKDPSFRERERERERDREMVASSVWLWAGLGPPPLFIRCASGDREREDDGSVHSSCFLQTQQQRGKAASCRERLFAFLARVAKVLLWRASNYPILGRSHDNEGGLRSCTFVRKGGPKVLKNLSRSIIYRYISIAI